MCWSLGELRGGLLFCLSLPLHNTFENIIIQSEFLYAILGDMFIFLVQSLLQSKIDNNY